ncbi:MAG: phosphomannomutase/phosphoglucomutase [Clostridia bacterium]|nr:phosphomannomutase/phosphoglucomutase [Clostridia bacterium]
MLEEKWSHLKSGTDIRGVASEGVEGENVNLTLDVCKAIVNAFAVWLSNKVGKDYSQLVVSVGRDSRISGPAISKTAADTLSDCGITVLDCGLASTPSMFMTTIDLECDGAVMITASHHPFNRNGLKFFTRDGGLESEDITSLLTLAQQDKIPDSNSKGEIRPTDYMTDYSARLRDIIKTEVNADNYEKPLDGFKIVVDAGNGAGGFYAEKVLAPLGADTRGSRYLDPDGMFPNHVPNPENAQAMKSICEAVLENNADLGVIFDTDVDRGGAVDSSGNEINRNRLVAVASAIALEGNDGGTIVTDSITSDGLKEFIETTLLGKHHRFKRGYKNVINEAIRLNSEGINCPLAIETSGHAAMRENYFLDDGAYLCTKIIIKAAKLRQEGKTLEDYVSQLKEAKEEKEVRYKINEHDFRKYGESVIDKLNQYALTQEGWSLADDSREGVRVSLDQNHGNGWFLLRLSVHDPIMPLNIESNDEGGVNVILEQVEEFIKTCDKLSV